MQWVRISHPILTSFKNWFDKLLLVSLHFKFYNANSLLKIHTFFYAYKCLLTQSVSYVLHVWCFLFSIWLVLKHFFRTTVPVSTYQPRARPLFQYRHYRYYKIYGNHLFCFNTHQELVLTLACTWDWNQTSFLFFTIYGDLRDIVTYELW